MEVILVLLPVALVLASVAVGAFLWASRRGQFDDLETPGIRVLFDEERPLEPKVGNPPLKKEASDRP